MKKIGIVAALVAAHIVAPYVRAEDKKPLEIIYFSNRQGEIEPCGCQTGQIGGLDRMVNHLRKYPPPPAHVLVDAGDTYFSLPEVPEIRIEQEKARAGLIAEAYRLVKLDAATLGERDLSAGVPEFVSLLSRSGAELVSANVNPQAGEPLPAKPFRIIERGGWRVGISGVTAVDVLSGVAGVKATPPLEALKTTVAELKKEKPDVIILLSHLGLAADRELAETGLVDIIVGSHSMDFIARPEVIKKTIIVQPDIEGRQIGRMMWTGSDLAKMEMTSVELDSRFDGANEITKAMKQYREKVRKLAFTPKPATKAAAKPAPVSGPFVAHPFQCRSCHEPQYEFWAKTKHSSAYLVLFAKNQHFNPECISCHSLGFESPLGFEKIAKPVQFAAGAVPAVAGEAPVESFMKRVFAQDSGKGPLDSRTDPARYHQLHDRYDAEIRRLETAGQIAKLHIGVQCEHCHGNRNGHPGSVTVKKVQKTACLQCHVPPNDTDFNFAKLVGQVSCPRMNRK